MSNSRNPEDGLHHSGQEPHLLREIMRVHQVLMSGFSRSVGIPASRFAILRTLANALPNGIGVVAIARQLGIDTAAVTRLVKDLEGERLVTRRADPKDGRRSYVRLTGKGTKTFLRVHERGHELEESLASVIGAEEMAAAARVLARLRALLEEAAQKESAGVPASS